MPEGDVRIKFQIAIQEARRALQRLERVHKDTMGDMSGSTDRASRRAGRSMRRMDRDARVATRNMSASFKRLKGSLQSLLPIMGAAGIGLAMRGIIKASVDLNAAMANVGTLISGNIKRIKELKTTVQDMAVRVGKSTDDLAGGLYQVISALGDTADTVKILEINARAAAAGLATTADAINLTSAVTKAYGDTSAEAISKVSDLAFQTVKLGQTTFPELAHSIGVVAPLASQLNVTVEEMFALFATLTGVVGDTNIVSTQLAAILRAMIKPTDAMKKAIAELGHSSAMTLIQEKGLAGALRELISTTDGSAESVAGLFQRAEALTSVFALNSSQAEIFNTKLKEIENSTGATDQAFKVIAEGINETGFAMKQASAEFKKAAQIIGDELSPALLALSKAVLFLMKDRPSETLEEINNLIRFNEARIRIYKKYIEDLERTGQDTSKARKQLEIYNAELDKHLKKLTEVRRAKIEAVKEVVAGTEPGPPTEPVGPKPLTKEETKLLVQLDISEALKNAQAMAKAWIDAKKAIEEYRKEQTILEELDIEEAEKNAAIMEQAWIDAKKAVEEYREEQEILEGLDISEAEKNAAIMEQAWIDAKKAVEEYRQKEEELQRYRVRRVAEAHEEIISGMSGFITDLTVHFDSLGEAWDNLMLRMRSSFMSLIADMLAQNIYKTFFKGGMDTIFNLVGRFLPGPPKLPTQVEFAGPFARGGVIHATKPTVALFGEAGEETATFEPGKASGQRTPVALTVVNLLEPDEVVLAAMAKNPNVILNPVFQMLRERGLFQRMMKG